MTKVSDLCERSWVGFSANDYLPLRRVNLQRAMLRLVAGITLRNIAASFWCLAHRGDRTPAHPGRPHRAQSQSPIEPTVPFAEKFWSKQQLRE